MDKVYTSKSWTDATAVVIAGGPSLTDADVAHVRNVWGEKGGVKIISVNESWRLTHDVLHVAYGADPDWWKNRGPRKDDTPADRWTQDKNWIYREADELGLKMIRAEPGAGISINPGFIYQGANSSFQAMNLAILHGTRRIVFLGLDLSADGTKTHWHEYPEKFQRREPGYKMFRESFEEAAPILKGLGVTVINASRRTVLEAFPRMTIQEALSC